MRRASKSEKEKDGIKMKKVWIIFGLLTGILCFTGCSNQNAESTVQSFCESMTKFDLDGMKEKMINDDEIMDNSMKNSGFSSVLLDLCKDNAKQIKYSIVDSKEDGNTAKVKVKFEYMDVEPLLTVTMAEYMQKGMALALSGKEMDESTGETLFSETLKEKMTTVKGKTIKKTIELSCKNEDGKWKIVQVPAGVLDVMTANISHWIKNMGEKISFEGNNEEISGDGDDSEQSDELEKVTIDVSLGSVAALKTMKLKVNSVSETSELKTEYDKTLAPTGTKYVVFQLEVENTTKKPFNMDTDSMVLVDTQERTFNQADDVYCSIDDLIEYEEIAPNIKKTGSLVFNVPTDATNYCLLVAEEDSNERYQFWATAK